MFDAAVQQVKIISNAADEDFQTGRTKAPVFTDEDPQSVNVLLDSKNRTDINLQTNPFDFRSNINSNLFRSRFMRVRKVIFPKPCNITINNNVFELQYGPDTAVSVTIPVGFYNTVNFANALTNLLNIATPGIFWTLPFDATTRTFKLSNLPATPFYISSAATCLFNRWGKNFAQFQAFDPVTSTVAGQGALFWNSGVAGMLFTRYVLIASIALNTFSVADTRTNDVAINEDLIAIVDMTNLYSEADWAVGTPFAGGYHTVETPEAPHISLRNPQRNLTPEIDLYVLDEFGFNLNDCFNLGPDYPPNQEGVVVWMEVSF
jgi:hypothetical protein